jgi:hypothetical protein
MVFWIFGIWDGFWDLGWFLGFLGFGMVFGIFGIWDGFWDLGWFLGFGMVFGIFEIWDGFGDFWDLGWFLGFLGFGMVFPQLSSLLHPSMQIPEVCVGFNGSGDVAAKKIPFTINTPGVDVMITIFCDFTYILSTIPENRRYDQIFA